MYHLEEKKLLFKIRRFFTSFIGTKVLKPQPRPVVQNTC